MEEWITVKEAAKIRNCTERNIIKIIDKGDLEAKKDGRRWLVLMDTSEPSTEKEPNNTELISVFKVQLEEKDKQIERLQKQLEDKDRVIDDASQRHDTIVLQLTRQLEQSQRMLEAHQEPWYRRFLGRKNRAREVATMSNDSKKGSMDE
jgi:excisionase family DNA binding protein